jgi:hypothetical protein
MKSDAFSDELDLNEEHLEIDESDQERMLKEHFELQISKEALDALGSKEFIKAAMLSWSYIEEYFLPIMINRLAKFHNLPLNQSVIEKTNVNIVIYYYYLLSHDHKLFLKLEKARKARNKLVHNLYSASSIEKIDKLAKDSAMINLKAVMEDIWDRESGKIAAPSTMIAINARNELRQEQRKRLKDLMP